MWQYAKYQAMPGTPQKKGGRENKILYEEAQT
jgi:hypothetical protein